MGDDGEGTDLAWEISLVNRALEFMSMHAMPHVGEVIGGRSNIDFLIAPQLVTLWVQNTLNTINTWIKINYSSPLTSYLI